MANELTSNVFVPFDPEQGAGGIWYGPSYPDNEVTDAVAAKITNPAAWAAPAADPFDFGADRTPQAVLDGLGMGRQDKPLEQRTKAELVDHAASTGVEVDPSATKADVLAALQAAGVEG